MSVNTHDQGIAIDGGGTRCRIAYFAGDDFEVIEVGPTNVSSDFRGAVDRLSSGLDQIAKHAPIPLGQLPAYLGLAGVTGPDLSTRVAAALPFKDPRIEDDRRAALVGALGDEDGAISHCGTGSFFVAQFRGIQRFAGGWGSVLGDEASAYWIAKKALGVTLAAADGLCPKSPLTEALMQRFGTPAAIVAFAGSNGPDQLATVAQDVTRYAAQADPHAEALLKAAADHIEATLPRLGWTRDQSLCLTGGIAPHFGPYLHKETRDALIPPKGSPLTGAIALCKQLNRSN